jgi:uncharacterized protein YbaR (Trm112 family)
MGTCPKCGGPVTVFKDSNPYTAIKEEGHCTNPKCGGHYVVKDGNVLRTN